MKHLSEKLIKSAVGNGLISASGFLSSLAILYYLGSNAFAQSAYLLAMAQILATFLSLRLEQYISTVKGSDGEFTRSVTIILTLVICSFVVFHYTMLLQQVGLIIGNSLIYLLACSGLIALSKLVQNFIISMNAFTELTKLRVHFAWLQPSSQLIFGYVFSDTVNGILFGLSFANLVFIIYAFQKFELKFISLKSLESTLGDAKKFITISLAADMFSSLSGNILIIYLNGKLSPENYLAVVVFQRFIAAPLGVISRIFFDVFKGELSAAEQHKFFEICQRFTVKMFFSGLLIILVITIALIGMKITGILEGTITPDLVFVYLVMVPVLILRFAISSTSYVLYFIGRQEIDFGWQIMNFSCIFAAMHYWDNPIIGYSIASSILYTIYAALIWRALNGNNRCN